MVGESDERIFSKITPSKPIIDLNLLEGSLSTEEGFRAEVQKLCPDERMPVVFPLLPTYFKAKKSGLVTNRALRNRELSLPGSLYDSNTYRQKPELRGPLEEILIAYEKERFKQGLPSTVLVGNEWTQTFVKRFKKIHRPPVGKFETSLEENEPEVSPKLPIKGRKLA